MNISWCHYIDKSNFLVQVCKQIPDPVMRTWILKKLAIAIKVNQEDVPSIEHYQNNNTY